MKKQSRIKWLIFLILYACLYPITLIAFQLIPYIVTNNTDIEWRPFFTDTLKNMLKTTQTILTSNYKVLFLMTQVVILFAIYIFLNPKKRQPYEFVGKTNPIHGAAFWGEAKELDALKQVHLVKEKSVKNHLLESMKGAPHD